MKNILLSLTLLLLFSCDDDKIWNTSTGKLKWFGDPALDGCGLVLDVDTVLYFVHSKRDAFITFLEEDSSGIDVTATYRVAGEKRTIWGCTTIPAEIKKISRH